MTTLSTLLFSPHVTARVRRDRRGGMRRYRSTAKRCQACDGYCDSLAGDAVDGYRRRAGEGAGGVLRSYFCAHASGIAGELQAEIRAGDRLCAECAWCMAPGGERP